MNYIGERIRARRAQLHMTQGRLAEMAGITASAVSQIESGSIRTLKNETLARVASALAVPESELTAGLEADTPLLADEHRLLEYYRSLSGNHQEVALRLLKALR